MLKLISRYYKKVWLKSTSTFEQQTGLTLQLVTEKTWCRKMRHRFQHFLKFLVHSDPKSTKKALTLKKTQTQSICNQIIFGNQLQTFPQKAIRKNFNLKRETQLKNTFQQRSQVYLSIQSSKRKSSSSFNSLCLNNIGPPGQRRKSNSKNSNFFPGFAGPKLTWGMRTATNEWML